MSTFFRSQYKPKILDDVVSFLVTNVDMFYKYVRTDR